MAKPPVSPLNINGKPMDYFDNLVEMVSPVFVELGVHLNFNGYKETIATYGNLKDDDAKLAWKLSRDLNMWSEYFADLSNMVQKLLLDSETDKIEQIAVSSVQSDPNKVANGDRLANKDMRVVNIRKKRNSFKAFNAELEAKVRFLERAYYHCKQTCDWNYNSKNNNTPI